MILHTCIECDYFELIPVADVCPAMQKYTCPECNTVQWIRHSRIDPETYSDDMVVVDEETKSVRIKGYSDHVRSLNPSGYWPMDEEEK